VLDNRGRLGKNVHKAIVKAAINAFHEAAESKVHELTRKWYRKNMWSTWLFGRMMDDEGGAVDYRCLELIRKMATTNGNLYVRKI
jgi:hypothetical protein